MTDLKKSKVIGIIGLGDMGHMYATRLAQAGWKVCACDVESKYESLKAEFANEELIEIVKNGHYVSRSSDYVIYSVEAEAIGKIVQAYGPSTKLGAIVGGQTSCKAPEIAAFEKHLPADVQIVTCHSLHGPKVNPEGQPLVIIRHKANDEAFDFVQTVLSCLKSQMVYLTAEEHDRITADTQAVTHAAFLSMGTAWKANNQYPWDNGSNYIGGLENAKVNISLRIYANKWHVYAGLAITNPSAHHQVLQYANSVTELFKLMITKDREALTKRIYEARDFIFGSISKDHEPLLSDELLGQFSLNKVPPGGTPPNNHLSILAIADSWKQLGVIPYDHMICSTPLFRIWLGVTEFLFCKEGMLEACIESALNHEAFRQDDLEFTVAARSWSKIISRGSFDLYQKEFEETQAYFSPRLSEAVALGNEMINTILSHSKH